MRIAIVTTSWPRFEHDASGHFVRAEARRLEREGHRIVLFAPPPGGAFGWPGAAARMSERPWRALAAAGWVSIAATELRATSVDRVVAHWALPCAWPIGVAARGAELDVVSHGGDVRLLLRLPAPARRRIARTIAGRARDWRFVSEPLLAALLQALDRHDARRVERIASVRGSELEFPDVREAVLRKRTELGTARVAACVGRLVASKRVDRVLRHVALRRDFDFLVVVGDGPERGRLERLSRALEVEARFVGALPRDETLAWIGAADTLIHASVAEGLSTVVREAEALGTRVLRL
jgi:glycosyltransferase involved in cell wall biosynthesis